MLQLAPFPTVQWGMYDITGNWIYKSFPIAFPNKCCSITSGMVNTISQNQAATSFPTFSNISQTGFDVVVYGGAQSNFKASVTAVGY